MWCKLYLVPLSTVVFVDWLGSGLGGLYFCCPLFFVVFSGVLCILRVLWDALLPFLFIKLYFLPIKKVV